MDETAPPLQLRKFISARWQTILLYAVVVVAMAFLFLYRLDVSPEPWFDEGAFLNVAKTYAEDGVYAESNSAGYRYTGPVVSTGPTVILPIALLFKVIGPSLLAARLVIVVFGIITLAAFFRLGTMMFDWKVALLACVLALFSGGSVVIYMFRNVAGQIPGLFFLFAGLLLWLRPGKRSTVSLIVVGILLGLAGITKFQYGLFILPAILCAWILELIWYRQKDWRYFILPGVFAGLVVFGWAYYALFVLGGDARSTAGDVENLQTAGTNAYFVLDPHKNLANLRYLLTNIPFGLFLPGLLYGFIKSIPRDERAQRYGILYVLLLIGSASFVVSIGWDRNALPLFFIAALFNVQLLADLTNDFHLDWNGIRSSITQGQIQSTRVIIAIIVIGLGLGTLIYPIPVLSVYRMVALYGSDSVYEVNEYLSSHVAQDAVIETWEKEVSALSDYDFHFPPGIVETYINQYERGLGPPASERYDFRDYVDPEYVITGAYSNGAQIYSPNQLSEYELVQELGKYDIYRRKSDSR